MGKKRKKKKEKKKKEKETREKRKGLYTVSTYIVVYILKNQSTVHFGSTM